MAIIGPFDFTGGLCTGYDLTTLPPKNYATIMANCRIKGGHVVSRWCQTEMSTAFAASVLALKTWRDTVLGTIVIVATSNSKLYISSDLSAYTPEVGSVTYTERTGAIPASSLSGLTTFDALNNILAGSANSASGGVPFKVTAYNANGAILGGSPPSADIVKQVNNFLFLSRNLSATTTQSKVYWSNVNDPETWTAANVLEFNKNNGEPIMALGSIGSDLYIFKRTSIGRLSTITLTVSGAVTLGPLVTVIEGVGCCGPRALDNLPNGNIVFVSTSGHFYEFDGSTLNDLSREDYPGCDVYGMGNTYTNSFSYGLSGCTPDVNVNVKTRHGINEVAVCFTSSLYGNGFMTYCYNFEQRRWDGFTTDLVASVTTLPIGGNFGTYPVESFEVLVHGTAGTKVIYVSGSAVKSYSTNDASPPTAAQFNVGTVIDLKSQDGSFFIPRSLCVETSSVAAGTNCSVSAFTVYADLDTPIPTTLVFTGPVGQQPTRTIIPLSFKQDSVGTNIFPAKLSVIFRVLGTGSFSTSGINPDIIRIGKFWLSDEIIR